MEIAVDWGGNFSLIRKFINYLRGKKCRSCGKRLFMIKEIHTSKDTLPLKSRVAQICENCGQEYK